MRDFCEDPKEVHGKALEYIVGYLKKTRNKGIVLKPDKKNHLKFIQTQIAQATGINKHQNLMQVRQYHVLDF